MWLLVHRLAAQAAQQQAMQAQQAVTQTQQYVAQQPLQASAPFMPFLALSWPFSGPLVALSWPFSGPFLAL